MAHSPRTRARTPRRQERIAIVIELVGALLGSTICFTIPGLLLAASRDPSRLAPPPPPLAAGGADGAGGEDLIAARARRERELASRVIAHRMHVTKVGRRRAKEEGRTSGRAVASIRSSPLDQTVSGHRTARTAPMMRVSLEWIYRAVIALGLADRRLRGKERENGKQCSQGERERETVQSRRERTGNGAVKEGERETMRVNG